MNVPNPFLLILALTISGFVTSMDGTAQIAKQVSLSISASNPKQPLENSLNYQVYKYPKVGVPDRREGAGTR